MVYVILLLLVVLVTKSLFLDDVKVIGDALVFKQFVEKSVDEEEKYNGFLKKHGVTTYKVVSIKKVEKEGTSSIIAYDNAGKKGNAIEIQGAYVAKIRGYLFHVIPYKEFKVKSEWTKEQ
ncbi:hypothetical protein EV214_110110 [Marinisporobacter balticus]|uniref:Uncharacterized protein n=2 Tax=Marinisporobacter balticus TaxID=2018667 RepID=A0A4R2KV44_9FIRM|nr:hypothetical protein EV214_110110 [Marinisporobacter balticus]